MPLIHFQTGVCLGVNVGGLRRHHPLSLLMNPLTGMGLECADELADWHGSGMCACVILATAFDTGAVAACGLGGHARYAKLGWSVVEETPVPHGDATIAIIMERAV